MILNKRDNFRILMLAELHLSNSVMEVSDTNVGSRLGYYKVHGLCAFMFTTLLLLN